MEAETHSQAETLLIVDDEPLVTDLFRQFMTKRGFEVLTAASGVEAIQLATARSDTIRLVITDMTMPDMDGVAVARHLYARFPTLPIMIATGHDLDAEAMQLPPNVVSIVRKPYQNKVLATRIREILDGGQ